MDEEILIIIVEKQLQSLRFNAYYAECTVQVWSSIKFGLNLQSPFHSSNVPRPASGAGAK